MVAHVALQIARLCKSLSAAVTFVGLLSRVNAHVRLEIDELREPLVAAGARIRLDVLVHHHMSFQVKRVGCREFLAANLAFGASLKRFVVQPPVLLQRLRSEERLVAFWTNEWPLACVSSRVRVKIALGGEQFDALRALETRLAVDGARVPSPHVVFELVCLSKSLAAMRTTVGVLARVSLHVLAEVSRMLEFHLAYGTRHRRLSGMLLNVNLWRNTHDRN